MAGCLSSNQKRSSIHGGERSIGLKTVVDGLNRPISLSFGPENTQYVADNTGEIYHYSKFGNQKLFLDLTSKIKDTGWETGLLGFTLHPNFDQNGRFYVRYSGSLEEDMQDDYNHTFYLSEFAADSDLSDAKRSSERTLLSIPQRSNRHQAGDIVFGPDDYLYVPLGDDAVPAEVPQAPSYINNPRHSQNLKSLKGSILRIDVDNDHGGRGYGIPGSNPLVGSDGKNELFAWGFRNPWQISFTGSELFVGDVGSGLFEEINLVTKGENYGWRIKEGYHCNDQINALSYVSSRPQELLDPQFVYHAAQTELGECVNWTNSKLVDPIISYPNVKNNGGEDYEFKGSACICGHRYSGDEVRSLKGKFLFGDLSVEGDGQLLTAESTRSKPWSISTVGIRGTETGRLPAKLLAITENDNGTSYVLTTKLSEGTGSIKRVVS
jgi:hypothetical protein